MLVIKICLLHWELQRNLNEANQISYTGKESDFIKMNSACGISGCGPSHSPLGVVAPAISVCQGADTSPFVLSRSSRLLYGSDWSEGLTVSCCPETCERFSLCISRTQELWEDRVPASSKWHVWRNTWFSSSDSPQETWSKQGQNAK